MRAVDSRYGYIEGIDNNILYLPITYKCDLQYFQNLLHFHVGLKITKNKIILFLRFRLF